MEFEDDHKEDGLQSDYYENFIYETFKLTEEELQNKILNNEHSILHKNEIDGIAFTLFSSDKEKPILLDYFITNFNGVNKAFTELTKYNQIFFYFNQEFKISKELYKELVLKKYGFNYDGRDIKGETKSHQKILKNLEILFKQSKTE